MTTDELRQICVRYIKLSVSFQWIPNQDFSYSETVLKTFDEGKLYGGIPYINTASGNLYRIMEYYDPETGILDCSFFADSPRLFGTACSGTAGWAWSRVVNSAEISWTHSMNVKHGFVPVGPYQYDHSFDRVWSGSPGDPNNRMTLYSWKTVCKENGKQVMYESYAETLPADCFSSNGHVRMSVEKPNVVRKEDGTIDGKKSTVILAEQGLYNTGEKHKRTTSDGTVYQIRGDDGSAFTFEELYKDGYVPHTFKEFLGTDPVEKGAVTTEQTSPTTTTNDLVRGKLISNYPISDVIVTVRDAAGAEKLRFVRRMENHFTREVELLKALPITGYIQAYEASGDHTITIEAQISTGEKLVAYSGTLVK